MQQTDNGISEIFPNRKDKENVSEEAEQRTAYREVLKKGTKTHAKMGTKFRSKNGTTWPYLQVTLTTFDKNGATFGCENGPPKNVRNRYPFFKKKRPFFYRRAADQILFR